MSNPSPQACHNGSRASALIVAYGLLVVGSCASSGVMIRGQAKEWLGLMLVTLSAFGWLWVYVVPRLPNLPPIRLTGAAVLMMSALGQPFFLWRMVHHQSGPLVMAMRSLSLLAAVATAVYLGLLLTKRSDSVRRGIFLALIALCIAVQALMIRDAPDPGTDKERYLKSWATDVWSFTNNGAAALLRGENPYAVTYPPWVAPGKGMWDYYTYPPGNLLLSVPGYLVFRDVRTALLGGLLVAALLLYCLAQGAATPEKELLVLLLLMHPRSPYLIEQAFNEYTLAAVALAVLYSVAERKPIAVGFFTGLLLATKQYTVVFLPSFLRAHMPLRVWLTCAASLALIVGPFALWNASALWQDVVAFLLGVKPSYDGLNWTTAVHWLTGLRLTSVWPVAALGALCVLWRQGVGLACLSGSAGLVLLFCFLFGRYAFLRYYWFAGALLLAHVASVLREEHPSDFVVEVNAKKV